MKGKKEENKVMACEFVDFSNERSSELSALTFVYDRAGSIYMYVCAQLQLHSLLPLPLELLFWLCNCLPVIILVVPAHTTL